MNAPISIGAFPILKGTYWYPLLKNADMFYILAQIKIERGYRTESGWPYYKGGSFEITSTVSC